MTRWWHAWCDEVRHVLTDHAVLLVFGGGLLFYALLYPLPYHRNVPGEQAVAVLDHDRGALARQLVRWVDATPQIRITAQPRSLYEARALLAAGTVHGLLVIPEQFERDVYLGRPTTLSYAGDASYFLIYSNIVQGLVTAGTTLTVQTQVARALRSGDNPARIPGQVMALRVTPEPVFNSSGGYINYIVPAVFALILHQTLLITAGSVTVKDRRRRAAGQVAAPPGMALMLRGLLFVLIYVFFALLYFGFFFAVYDVPRVAPPWALLGVAGVFLASTTVCAMLIGYLVSRPELPTVVVLITSLPIVFTAGFAWPAQSLPAGLDALSWVLPARPGIQALLTLNQMGGGLAGVRDELLVLVVQGLVYALLLGKLVQRQTKKSVLPS